MSRLNQMRLLLQSEEAEEDSGTGLHSFFRALPSFSPQPAFVDSVMAELGFAPAYRLLPMASWGSRAALLVCLLFASSALFLVPLVRLIPLPQPGDLLAIGVAAAQLAAAWWALAVSLWGFLFAVSEKASLIFTAPEAMFGLFLTSSLGLLACRWLVSQTQQQRSSVYVESS